MALQTRKPTGQVPWPFILLAGVEKSGKTFACAQASASELVGRTLWFGVGEDDPDEYAAIPGADFELVEHDGTHRGIADAMTEGLKEPDRDGKPTLWVIDSGTRLWNLESDTVQTVANARRNKKGRGGDDEAQITMDLWNLAKQRWAHLIDLAKQHHGPTILTARLELVTVMDERGNPTKDKIWKIQTEKNAPYEAGVVIQMRAFGEVYLTGVRSLRIDRPPTAESRWQVSEDKPLIDTLWRNLGLADGKVKIAAATRPGGNTADPDVDPSVAAAREFVPRVIAAIGDRAELKPILADAEAAGVLDVTVDAPDSEGTMTSQPLRQFILWAGHDEQVKRVQQAAAEPAAADADDAVDLDGDDLAPAVCDETGCEQWADHDGPHTVQEVLA